MFWKYLQLRKDIGKIIGKRRRIANALSVIVRAAGSKLGKRVQVNISHLKNDSQTTSSGFCLYTIRYK